MVEEMDNPAQESDIKDQSIKIVNHLKGLINNVYQNKTQAKPFETAELINNNAINTAGDKDREPAPPLQFLEETKPTNGVKVVTANGIRIITNPPTTSTTISPRSDTTQITTTMPTTTTTDTTTASTTTTTPTTTIATTTTTTTTTSTTTTTTTATATATKVTTTTATTATTPTTTRTTRRTTRRTTPRTTTTQRTTTTTEAPGFVARIINTVTSIFQNGIVIGRRRK